MSPVHHCSQCNATLAEDARFCHVCGSEAAVPTAPPNQRRLRPSGPPPVRQIEALQRNVRTSAPWWRHKPLAGIAFDLVTASSLLLREASRRAVLSGVFVAAIGVAVVTALLVYGALDEPPSVEVSSADRTGSSDSVKLIGRDPPTTSLGTPTSSSFAGPAAATPISSATVEPTMTVSASPTVPPPTVAPPTATLAPTAPPAPPPSFLELNGTEPWAFEGVVGSSQWTDTRIFGPVKSNTRYIIAVVEADSCPSFSVFPENAPGRRDDREFSISRACQGTTFAFESARRDGANWSITVTNGDGLFTGGYFRVVIAALP